VTESDTVIPNISNNPTQQQQKELSSGICKTEYSKYSWTQSDPQMKGYRNTYSAGQNI
jgi:hypothetical protein